MSTPYPGRLRSHNTDNSLIWSCHMKPGSWVELHELDYICHCDDGSAGPDYRFSEMMVYVTQGCAATGINLYRALTMANRIKEVGFINVTERIPKIPTLLDGLQGIALGPLCRGLDWSRGAHGPPRLLLVCNHI